MGFKSAKSWAGGSVVQVVVKLVVISIIVGFILAAFDLDAVKLAKQLLLGIEHLIETLSHFGVDTVMTLGKYFIAGAVIVIPIWLIGRLLAMRKR